VTVVAVTVNILNRKKSYPTQENLMVECVVEQTKVTHIIVRRVFDNTKLLGNLTKIRNNKQPIQTLSRADEKLSCSSPWISPSKPSIPKPPTTCVKAGILKMKS
jgi:hypothetical protein